MRLIDADELKEAMEEHTDYKGYLVCDPEEIIDLAPTIEERPRGEWLPTDEIGNVVRCSRCSFRTCADVAEEDYNFCPKCGADMREKKDDLAEIIEATRSMKDRSEANESYT